MSQNYKFQGGFTSLLVVIIVIAVGAVAYFGFVRKSDQVAVSPSPTVTVNNSKLPSPTPKSTTASWKVYTNAKYGFEIKYPNNWYFADENNNNADGFFISKLSEGPSSQFAILPNGEFDAGYEGIPMTANKIISGKNVVMKKWELQNDASVTHYYFTDAILGWTKCGSDLKNCNRLDMRADSSADSLTLQEILSTFKFTK